MVHLTIHIDHVISSPLFESHLRFMVLGGIEILVSVSHPDYVSTDRNMVEKQQPTEINNDKKYQSIKILNIKIS